MTRSHERTRALAWRGTVLVQIACDKSLPLKLLPQARVTACDFPAIEDVGAIASTHVPVIGNAFAASEVEWQSEPEEQLPRWSTHFAWPADKTGSDER